MDVQTERMYCAEQINVPLELPEILKAFIKQVVLENPQNLVEFGARYFTELANETMDFEFPLEQFRDLRLAFEDIDTDSQFILSKETIGEVVINAGFSDLNFEGIWQHANFGDSLNWKEFIVFLTSLQSLPVPDALNYIFEIFSSEEDSSLTLADLSQLADFLFIRQENLPENFASDFKQAIGFTGDDIPEKNITFSEILESGILDVFTPSEQ
ncbi:hypothetical protein BLNAU_13140 [Blattamonas nauphoetae]|uniref:RIIa domain-containing protein n=1 Tax=Blattamonas nauphoetae TaxID=2049346 RepID=A0ABQ9XJJ0_9EUKA|nr:hypothetical protein BLNAU_13140 [Blattamonas nauphoetae]